MTSDIIIISAGKMGRFIFNWLEDAIAAGQPWRIKGFLDNRPAILDGYNYDAPILASVEDYAPAENDRFVCAIGDLRSKRMYCEQILAKGGRFINLIHPTALLGRNVVLGTGVIIGPYSIIDPDLAIGNFVSIFSHAACAHDSVIGDWSQICDSCSLAGNVQIGEMAYIGAHSCLIPSARVGAGAYVGAGSVVLKCVPPKTKVFGVPAVPIGPVDD